jgi:hypothetical protein
MLAMERSRLAALAPIINLAVAAAMGSDEARRELEDAVSFYSSDPEDPDSTDAWLVNPDAKGYDLDDFAAAGIPVERVQSNGQEVRR